MPGNPTVGATFGLLPPNDGRERGKRGFKEVLLAPQQGSKDPAGAMEDEEDEVAHLKDTSQFPDLSAELTPFNFEAVSGKRPRLSSERSTSASFGHFDFGWVREDLEQLCQDSLPLGAGVDCLELEVDSKPLLEDMQKFQNTGVILYFMGKILKGFQLKAWADAIGGNGCVSRFLFLGKGFYLGICKDGQLKHKLLESGGVWGSGFFALALPWHDSFDPMSTFLHFCPVWLTFKSLPPFLIPHVSSVAGKVGKILFIPPIGSYVCSRNITVCLLWDLKKKIPRVLKLKLGMRNPLFIQVAVHSFPTACYKCKTVGHFAKQCRNAGLDSGYPLEQQQGSPTTRASLGDKHVCPINTASPREPPKHYLMDSNNNVAHSKAENISLDSRSLFVDLGISESVNPKPKNTEVVLGDVTNTSQSIGKKKKQKKKRKKPSTQESMEAVNVEPSQERKEDLSEEGTVAGTEVIAEISAEGITDLVEAKNADEELLSVEGKKEEMTQLDAIDEDILASTPEYLHKFYVKGEHYFYIPAVVKKNRYETQFKVCDKWWLPPVFFKENKLTLDMVIFNTPEGDLEWHGQIA